MILRAVVVVVVASVITLAIFLFMQFIIQSNPDAIQTVDVTAVVELYQQPPRPEEDEPEVTPPEPEQVADLQPAMQQLEVAATTPSPQLEQAMPAIDMGSMAINVGDVGSSWSAPLVGGAGLLQDIGKDSKGYIELVPYTTRQPNIPDIAWKNKLNGWVLVAFKVGKQGYTKDIRVLDANPRGIFEANVIDAIKSWRYSVKQLQRHGSDVLLTQKVELYWKNYPHNMY